MAKQYKMISHGGLVIGHLYPHFVLEAAIYSVCDMYNTERLGVIERILDDSPIAAVSSIIECSRVRRRDSKFAGNLCAVARESKNPTYATIDTTSGGRMAFSTIFDLRHEGRIGPPNGWDRGYSWINVSLARKKLTTQDISEFKDLFVKLAVAADAFYAESLENTMQVQRDRFLVESAKNIFSVRRLPDFSRDLYDICWLNYFGPVYVKHWGRKKVNALAQGYNVKHFSNGAICVQTTPEPPIADDSVTGIKDYDWKRLFYKVLGQDTFMNEIQKQGAPGQYVPHLEDHRRIHKRRKVESKEIITNVAPASEANSRRKSKCLKITNNS